MTEPAQPLDLAPIQARCHTCRQPIHWVDCPTGGWWRHDQHPTDNHDAEAAR